MLRAAVLATLLLLPLPFAAAAAPACTAQNTGGMDQPAYTRFTSEYPREYAEVWLESNGVPGLQAAACSVDGVDRPADTRVVRLDVTVDRCIDGEIIICV